MISQFMIKIINMMPDKMVSYLSKKVLGYYVNTYANININGYENIKDLKQNVLFVSNHLSNGDALILNEVLKEQNIVFVAGKKLGDKNLTKMGLSITETIFIKPNSADKDAISNIVKTIKGGRNVLIFPEGTRSRKGAMIEGKQGTFLIARLSKASIVPIGITGTEKFLPINDDDMGKEKFQHADITVNIGKPISLPKKGEEEDKKEYRERGTEYIMRKIAELLPEQYRGIYK